jgi:hypothetical protein
LSTIEAIVSIDVGRMTIEGCLLSGSFEIDDLGPDAQLSIAQMEVFDPHVLIFGFDGSNRGGNITLNGVSLRLSNGRWASLNKQMPGTVVATQDDIQVGTLAVQPDWWPSHRPTDISRWTSTPADWWSNTAWHYHSDAQNFTLHKLATTRVFGLDFGGTLDEVAAYANLCDAAGLRPVTTGEHSQGRPCSAFEGINCMALTDKDGGSVPNWIHESTGWVDIVTLGSGPPHGSWMSLISMYLDGQVARGHLPIPEQMGATAWPRILSVARSEAELCQVPRPAGLYRRLPKTSTLNAFGNVVVWPKDTQNLMHRVFDGLHVRILNWRQNWRLTKFSSLS